MLTTKQAAEQLGVSRARVIHLICARRLRAEKFGQAWMIREIDLDAVRVRKPGRPKKIGTKTLII